MNQKVWAQWDYQEERRAFCKLNNLYLQLESGEIEMTIHTYNDLHRLLRQAYSPDETMAREYWMREFENLPNYND
jgi:hypothetical protein